MSAADKMNLFLKERRKKLNKVKSYRKSRIFKNYHKLKNSQSADQEINNEKVEGDAINQPEMSEENTRKINFYNSVFKQEETEKQINGDRTGDKKKKKKKKNAHKKQEASNAEPVDQRAQAAEKISKLKSKKVKFIKKMQTQKTSRGQPVMRNMIKYALTKLEEDRQKDKLKSINLMRQQERQKKETNRQKSISGNNKL